ncbi:hypothetical protein Bca52824_013261 [Brassica carinata]|uniref:Uncharacterized protein n=1 Tax=Brassica carinata TaxID=52824 RepID=A0A8X8B378_BRACI|nr:hypothetical protein Bca52824_013261 [Brassica carinata]
MDPVASVVEKVKLFKDLVSRHFSFHESPSRQNPVSFIQPLHSSFESAVLFEISTSTTHVRGEVDVLGAMLMMGDTDEESFSGLDREGVRPGLLSRFVFETRLRETDSLAAELTNMAASLAQSISHLEPEQCLNATNRCFRTFGQVTCNILRGVVKLSLLAVTRFYHLFLRRCIATEPEPSTHPLEMSRASSIALKLDTLMDESTRIGGWIEMQNSREKQVKWSVSITDKPEDEVGWGMSVGGVVVVDGSRNHDRFQVESYLKFNIGHRFSLSPCLVYLTNSQGRTVGLLLQSHWSL